MSQQASSRRPPQRNGLPRYDEKLRAAKNADKTVRFCLAVDTYFTESDSVVDAKIVEVDKFDVEVHPLRALRTVWIKKSAIVSTEIL